ncbi:hypothetical protein [Dermacoccus nishinomiyaensis]|uniref:hypothetical protein n=1 Tax=Dermacoccus nishinomiyaensis TaxID=1274 RepID=UPI001F51179D|nr:hypothetical protein [Dermacoccus nishinomiyaensis]MCI0154124.1 hypothetical protein [Dermacoccus nishinomiyaensis]
MADFDDPSVEAMIQSFHEQLNDEENWPDVARELGLPPQAGGNQHASGAGGMPGAAFGLPAGGARGLDGRHRAPVLHTTTAAAAGDVAACP